VRLRLVELIGQRLAQPRRVGALAIFGSERITCVAAL
jgi:hypothetical protein